MGYYLTSPRPAGPHPAWSLVTSAIRRLRRSGTAVLSSRPESSRGVGSLAAATPRVFVTGPDGYLLQDASGPVPSHPYLAALQRTELRVASLHAANRGAPARHIATPQGRAS